MQGLWDATRPLAGWGYLAVLVLPALVGGLWRLRQVRQYRGASPRALSHHDLAYLHGGPREVVLAAVRRLRRTGVLAVTDQGLVHAVAPRRRLRDRIDDAIVANADFVFPKAFAEPLRSALTPTVERLADDGLVVRQEAVGLRRGTVLLLWLAIGAAGAALVVAGMVLNEPVWMELLFLTCAVPAVVITVRRHRPGCPVLTLRGQAQLVDAGLRPPPPSGVRRFLALFTLFAVFLRSSVPVPRSDKDDPDAWADDWPDTGSAWSDSAGGDSGSGGGES